MHSSTLSTLIIPTPITHTSLAHATIGPRSSISVDLIVRMPLRAMRTINVGIALIPGLDAGATLPMTSTRDDIGILRRVLMPLRTMSNLRFPAIAIINHVSRIIGWRSPVQIVHMIIIWIIITVKTIATFWTNADKMFQNKNMNELSFTDPIFIKGASPTLALTSAGKRQRQNASLKSFRGTPSIPDLTVQRPHATMVRHLVSRIAIYRQPSFITSHLDIVAYPQCASEIPSPATDKEG